MTDPTQAPAAAAAEPHATEETQMNDPTNTGAEPQARAVETRALPQAAPATPPDTEAIATRAREGERDRVSTIYDLAGRPNLERGFAEDLVKRGVTVDESRRLILSQVAARSDETRRRFAFWAISRRKSGRASNCRSTPHSPTWPLVGRD